MMQHGGCLCGAVRYSAEKAEPHYHACHCGMCRRWSGGPIMATSVANVTFEGEQHIKRYPSSEWAERGFCEVCGSGLFYYLKPADSYMLPVGTFDNADRFKLEGEIFIDNKPDGYAFDGNHPRLTEAEALAKFAPPED